MADILDGTVFFEVDASNVTGTRPTWPEFMPARDLNDSARAFQGSMKRWADQICATVATAGTGTAYTATYSVAPTALYNGQRFLILSHAACAATPTLNINTLGAKLIKKITTSGLADLAANDIAINMLLDLVYVTALNQFVWINSPGGLAAHTHVMANITDLAAALALKADLAGPVFSGAPTAPTAAPLTSTLQIASTAFVTAAVAAATSGGGGIVTKTASSTLLITDANNLVAMDVGSANNLTIPTNAAVAFALNTEIDIVQQGTGQTTIVAPGVTLNAAGSRLKLTERYSGATIKKLATNTWYVWGDLSA